MPCEQCQHGLSAVFGSLWYMECSNVYLLIIIPLSIAGIGLVLVLFILNLTVINGTINTFGLWIVLLHALFGLKFTLIFVVCLVVFFILLPFNLVLLCTRQLSYFKLVTTFKTLLDTHFSSYKDKVLYWTGLQLVIRAIVLALSGLLRDASLLVIAILLCIILL